MKALKVLLVVAMVMSMAVPATYAIHEDEITEVLSRIGITFAGYVRSRVSLDMKTTEGAAEDGGDLEETVFGGTGKGQVDFSATSPMGERGAWTASAKVSLVMNAGGASSDDAWVALSNESMEFKMGRFEAENLHGFGNDFYVVSAPSAPSDYQANKARGRKEAGAALKLNPSDAMMVEVGGVYGGSNFVGIRPLVKFSAGALTLTGGGEYYMEMPTDNDAESQDTVIGFGGKAEFGMGAMNFGVAAAYGIAGGKDAAGDDLDEENTLTASGWMTMGVGENGTLGLGVRYTMLDIEDVDDEDTHLQAYVSHTVKPFLNDNMKLEVGGAYAGADLAGDVTNTTFGVAMRLRYDF